MDQRLLLAIAAAVILLIAMAIRSKIGNKEDINDRSSEDSGISPVIKTTAPTANDDELIAVLTAAVVAASGSHPGFKLRVRSFRRIPTTAPVWNLTGRQEQISGNL